MGTGGVRADAHHKHEDGRAHSPPDQCAEGGSQNDRPNKTEGDKSDEVQALLEDRCYSGPAGLVAILEQQHKAGERIQDLRQDERGENGGVGEAQLIRERGSRQPRRFMDLHPAKASKQDDELYRPYRGQCPEEL